MQESLRIQNDRAKEIKNILLDVRDAIGDRFEEFLHEIGINQHRWKWITTFGHINLTEAMMVAKAIGVELDYFINCSVDISHVAKRFGNESYDSTRSRSRFTRKILELNSDAKVLHLESEIVTKSIGIIKNTFFCHS